MPATSNQIGSALFQSLSNKVSERKARRLAVTDDHSSYLYIASSRILNTSIEFEMLDNKPSMLSQMKNNCVMLLHNNSNKIEIMKKNERMNGDIHKTSHFLPKPKVVLYSPEQVKLGWQDKNMLVGSGLDNPIGTLCYINSTLQALFHIPAFVNWLLNDEQHKQKCQQKMGIQKDCIICVVIHTFKTSQKQTGSSFKATSIISNMYLICKTLSTSKQEDAHEFLRYLIESMERRYLTVLGHNNNSLDNYSRETTPFNQIFGGYNRTEVTCGKCGHISTTFQHFQDLILDIQLSNSISEALNKYFEKEPLDKSYVCDKCRTQVDANKQFSIEKAPSVLCVQLKRYNTTIGGLGESKNSKCIQINERLDLSKYQFEYHKTDARQLKYHLVSMVLHYGSSTKSGHYKTVGLSASGSCYCFNDSNVQEISLKKFLNNSSDSYIIFYELEPSRNINNTCVDNRTSTVTSSSISGYQSLTSTSNLPGNGFFSNKTNGVTKPLNVVSRPMNGIFIIKKNKKNQICDKSDSNIKPSKQENSKDKSQTELFSNTSNKFEPSTNCVNIMKTIDVKDKKAQFSYEWESTISKILKPAQPIKKVQKSEVLVKNSLVPYYTDKEDTDAECSSLSGDDNMSDYTTLILDKFKRKSSTDQKVPDKKSLEMRPKDNLIDKINEETPPKKCLVLNPQNDNSPVSETEKEILSTKKKCLVLKPKDDEEPLQTKIESVTKCLGRMPKNEVNTSKELYLIEEKNHQWRKNGLSDSGCNKSKNKLDQNNFNQYNSPIDCKINETNGKLCNGNTNFEDRPWRKHSNGSSHKTSNGTKNWPKFTNDFQTNGHNKSNGNSFKESMKSKTHLGFGGDVKTWNGEKSFLDRESEQNRHGGMKRSIDDDAYNEDFDRGIVRKKNCNKNNHHNIMKDNVQSSNPLQMLHNELNTFNGKMGRNKITWMNRTKNYRSYNNGYRHNGNGGYKKPRYNNNHRYWSKQR